MENFILSHGFYSDGFCFVLFRRKTRVNPKGYKTCLGDLTVLMTVNTLL